MIRLRGSLFHIVAWLGAALSAGCGRLGFDLLAVDGAGAAPGGDGGSAGARPMLDAAPDSQVGCAPSCVNGACFGGRCQCEAGWGGERCDQPPPLGNGSDGNVTFDGATNLSRDSAPGRSCADGGDAVEYSVSALSASSATLAAAPSTGCLAAGDAVLLSNRQGAAGASTNVGSYELLLISEVQGNVVSFTADKRNDYGSTGDEGIGADPGTQRVVMQRMPQYADVTVARTATVTADAWNGATGGVLAFRASGQLRIDGRITMDGRGFRGGAATTVAGDSGLAGESTEGPGAVGGGRGGRGEIGGAGCDAFGLPGGGGGHAQAGGDAMTISCDATALAAGGASYGDLTGARFYLGSGGGAGGASRSLGDNPVGGEGGNGGGVVLVFAAEGVGTGTISARGTAGAGDPAGTECSGTNTTDCWDRSGPGGGGAGGTIILRSPTVSVGTLLVRGGDGGNGLDGETGDGGAGADGYPIVSGLP